MSPQREPGALLRWKQQGRSVEEVAALCVAGGWAPVETIKALKEHFGVSIGEAKAMVSPLLSADQQRAQDFLFFSAALLARFPDDVTEADVDASEEETGWSVKLWGLVQAGRDADVRSAIDRFDAGTLRFTLLTMEEARQIVVSEIAGWNDEFQVTDKATATYEFGWVFFCQAARYLESGDLSDMLVGQGPLLVDRHTGVLWQTGSAVSEAMAASNYRETGDPRVSMSAR